MYYRPLRKWIQDRKERPTPRLPQPSSDDQLFTPQSIGRSHLLSNASPRSEERREKLRSQQKREQEEQFQRMHQVMMLNQSPLQSSPHQRFKRSQSVGVTSASVKSNEENENALKMLLGMNKGKMWVFFSLTVFQGKWFDLI